MQQHTGYGDVVADVVDELRARLEAASSAGIDPGRVAVDPGIGFSKTADQNWDVLAGTDRLHELGHPVLVATSRKRFLGALLADAVRRAAPTGAPRGRYDGDVGPRGGGGGVVRPHPPGAGHPGRRTRGSRWAQGTGGRRG